MHEGQIGRGLMTWLLLEVARGGDVPVRSTSIGNFFYLRSSVTTFITVVVGWGVGSGGGRSKKTGYKCSFGGKLVP